MSQFPYTEQGRHICKFEGDGDATFTQGDEIWKLGNAMTLAASTLKTLADGDDHQQGEAVEELRSKVGDAHVQLDLAGKLYKPIGTALKGYGTEVTNSIQSLIDTKYQEAHDAWTLYQGLPGDKDGRSYFLGIGKPDEGSPEADQHEQEDQAKKQAWDDWIAAAGAYDSAYDTWEDAWTTAVNTIDDGFSDDLKDSRWEKFKEFLGAALEVLKWAGLVVGILALIIGGPILAAIAAAIAVLTLIGTLILAFAGDRSWGDVAWAVVDLIPVGKLGKLFQAGEKMKFVKEMGKNFDPKTYKDGWDALKKFPVDGFGKEASKTFKHGVTALLSGKNPAGWKKLWTDNMDISKWVNAMADAGSKPNIFARTGERIIRFGGAGYEAGFTFANHVFKMQDWGTTIYNGVTGGDATSWRKSNPVTRFIF